MKETSSYQMLIINILSEPFLVNSHPSQKIILAMLLIRTIHSFTLYHTFQKRNLGENPCYGAKWFAHSRDPPFYYKIGAKMSRKFKSHPSQKIITVNSLPKV